MGETISENMLITKNLLEGYNLFNFSREAIAKNEINVKNLIPRFSIEESRTFRIKGIIERFHSKNVKCCHF